MSRSHRTATSQLAEISPHMRLGTRPARCRAPGIAEIALTGAASQTENSADE